MKQRFILWFTRHLLNNHQIPEDTARRIATKITDYLTTTQRREHILEEFRTLIKNYPLKDVTKQSLFSETDLFDLVVLQWKSYTGLTYPNREQSRSTEVPSDREEDDNYDNLDMDNSIVFGGGLYNMPQEIILVPDVYLGAYLAAQNRRWLLHAGITHILTVGSNMPPLFPKKYKYKVVEAVDIPEQKLLPYFEECIKFIEEGRLNGAVLVHCMSGISRGPTIIIAYLMYACGFSFEDAFRHVRQIRPWIEPNPSFQAQLLEFEKRLQEQREKKNSANP